jgi:hypothetical protein
LFVDIIIVGNGPHPKMDEGANVGDSYQSEVFLPPHDNRQLPAGGLTGPGSGSKYEKKGRGPEDGDNSRDESDDSLKRKFGHRDPESPGQQLLDGRYSPFAKKERLYYGDIDDSPSSYPKHVLVPGSQRQYDDKHAHSSYHEHPHLPPPLPPGNYSPEKINHGASILTPDSVGRSRSMQPSDSYDGSGGHSMYHRQQPYHDVYRAPSYQDMEYGPPSYGSHPPPPSGANDYNRPRRWACDYCNVATFLSYEEACAHEEACSRRHHQDLHYNSHPSTSSSSYGGPAPPPRVHHHHQQQMHHNGPPQQQQQQQQQPQQHGTGLGALYHASQEVVTPPTPHQQHPPSRWGSRGPPLPVLPHEQGYYRQGYYDAREEPVYPYRPEPFFHPSHHPQQQIPPPFHTTSGMGDPYQKRMLLAMTTDTDSLSDRQCYVRSDMVEIFAATDKDVSARHSKGAQKLVMGQVGIRCIHCSHLRPRDRAERAVCYPSSVSRIYQTVADMQRFHFEQCREIPEHVRQIYKKLKTTRPRGVGSPQTYWIQSARSLGLVDTEDGIRFDADVAKEERMNANNDTSIKPHS